MSLKIERTDAHIIITSDYNTVFVHAARNLAGKFHDIKKSWYFDIRDEADVLEACYLAYGEDGIRSDKCNAKITMPNGHYADKGTINILGRPIARAFGRDGGAKVFDGVIIKQGGFDSGGSMKNWTTRALRDTVIILRDVSHPLVLQEQDRLAEEGLNIEILADINTQKLIEERERLLARLAEINTALES